MNSKKRMKMQTSNESKTLEWGLDVHKADKNVLWEQMRAMINNNFINENTDHSEHSQKWCMHEESNDSGRHNF